MINQQCAACMRKCRKYWEQERFMRAAGIQGRVSGSRNDHDVGWSCNLCIAHDRGGAQDVNPHCMYIAMRTASCA